MKKQNTYSLLVNSQEKGRSIFESVIYALVVVCVAFTAWQFAASSVVTPGMNRTTNSSTPAQVVATIPADQAPVVASNN